MRYVVEIDDQSIELDVAEEVDGLTVRHEDAEIRADLVGIGPDGPYSVLLDGRSHEAQVALVEGVYVVTLRGQLFRVSVEEAARARLHGLAGAAHHAGGVTAIAAPMPGLVIGIPVAAGQAVKRGETVIVLQAMKMENELRAPRDGVIKDILVATGATVAQGQALVTLE